MSARQIRLTIEYTDVKLTKEGLDNLMAEQDADEVRDPLTTVLMGGEKLSHPHLDDVGVGLLRALKRPQRARDKPGGRRRR